MPRKDLGFEPPTHPRRNRPRAGDISAVESRTPVAALVAAVTAHAASLMTGPKSRQNLAAARTLCGEESTARQHAAAPPLSDRIVTKM